MKHKFKKNIKRIIIYAIHLFSKAYIGRYLYEEIMVQMLNKHSVVNHGSHEMIFSVPNRLCQYRIDTFSTKEPETLEWLDTLDNGAVLWDVGANIGLYSIYAVKSKNCNVYSFEPSVFNLEMLARNIFYNKMHGKITIIPTALTSKKGINLFKMTSTTWGGALSTFGEDYDQNGDVLDDVFEYSTTGMSMDDAEHFFMIPQPQYIKIDVDGIEHLVLSGGESILRNVDSVLIEINDNFHEQASKSAKYLQDAGLSLYKKCGLGVPHQYNQWWVRENGN